MFLLLLFLTDVETEAEGLAAPSIWTGVWGHLRRTVPASLSCPPLPLPKASTLFLGPQLEHRPGLGVLSFRGPITIITVLNEAAGSTHRHSSQGPTGKDQNSAPRA